MDRALKKLRDEELQRGGSCHTFWAPERVGKKHDRWSKEYLERVAAALSSPSFFSSRRMVIIKGAERLHLDDLKPLLNLVNRQDTGLTLVMVGVGGELQRRLARELKWPLTVIPALVPGRAQEVDREIRALAAGLKRKIAPQACEHLRELVGHNLLELKSQLEKVHVALDPGRMISVEDVDRVVGDSRLHVVWELVGAIGERNTSRALGLVHRMVEEGMELPGIVGALAFSFRQGWLAKEGGWRGASDAVQRARQFTQRKFEVLLKRLADIDVAFKSGRGETRWLLEEFVFEACRLPRVD